MSDRIVYKVMSAAEVKQMQRDGVFHGSPADIADGYIHLSGGSQLAATLDKHFSEVGGLMLAAVDLPQLGDAVRWESARGGQLFPHIYGVLPVEAVVSVVTLERTPDGAVKLPVWGVAPDGEARQPSGDGVRFTALPVGPGSPQRPAQGSRRALQLPFRSSKPPWSVQSRPSPRGGRESDGQP